MNTCKFCGHVINEKDTVCGKCIEEMQNIIDEDVVVSKINGKYAIFGLLKHIFGWLSIIVFFGLLLSLEYNIDEIIIALLLTSLLPTILSFLFFTILRVIYRKKVIVSAEKEMHTRISNKKGSDFDDEM